MTRRTSRSRSRNSGSWGCKRCCSVFGLAIGVIVLIGAVLGIKSFMEETIATQKELLSNITDDTPISGYYGPGAYWAWLITLGMTHSHSAMTFLATNRNEVLPEWDYDLMVASGYMAGAAIDVILKSRAIAELGENASESPLLPALICAERVVSVGTGSSIFTLTTAAVMGGVSNRRRVGVAVILLIFAIAASFSSLRAHEAISRTAPVLWCRLHDGSKVGKHDFPFSNTDFLAWFLDAVSGIFEIYMSRTFWKLTGMLCTVISVALFAWGIGQHNNSTDALLKARFGLILGGALLLSPLLFFGYLIAIPITKWLSFWVGLWWLVYILAFFPQMGYFPLTGISLMEMDQIAALLTATFIAAFRVWRHILEHVRH
ncbi:hypothetical protein C8R43DRAFT_1233815 [Mycena crocata]|nr:hypothetical protein C8R43DRAFT_1233815 [Mycena crocata]